jgi:glycosyltransferase involved in cell wall biosynthesis
MSIPAVSVCMPIYNSAPFLARAIDSVLEQSVDNVEIIIVDDCSTDGSAEIAAGYAGKDSRVRFEKNEQNRGMVANWNYCMELASAPYIHYMFGDDYFATPEAVELKLKILQEHPETSLVSSARLIVDEVGNQTDIWQGFVDLVSADPRKVVQACLKLYYMKDGRLKFGCLENYIGEPSAVMFRKAQALRGFSGDYRQMVDLEMWFHLLKQGGFGYLSEPLVAFRRHDAQQTVKNSVDFVHIEEYLALVKQYVSFAYPLFVPPISTVIVMSECYRIVNLQRRDSMFTREVAISSVSRVISPSLFRLMLPFYAILQPFYKGLMKLSGRFLTSYSPLMPMKQKPEA